MEDTFKYPIIALLYVLVGVSLKYVLKRYNLNDSSKIIDVFWIKFISNVLVFVGGASLIAFGFALYFYLV